MTKSILIVSLILLFVSNYQSGVNVAEVKSNIVCGGDISLLVYQEIAQNGSAHIGFSPFGSKRTFRLAGDKNENAFSPNGICISDSSFIFVWQGYHNMRGACIHAAIVHANGIITQDRRVFQYDGKDRYHPVIVPSLPNQYLVFWQDAKSGDYDIVASSISMQNDAMTSPFKVNEDTCEWSQYYPEAARVSNRILVIWQDRQRGHSAIWGQFLNVSGEKEGSNFLVSPGSELDQTEASIVSMGNRFAIIWQEAKPDTMRIMMRFIEYLGMSDEVLMRDTNRAPTRTNAQGAFFYDVIQVSESNIARACTNAQGAFFHDGKLVAIWMDQRGGNLHIYGQLFDHTGDPIGNNFEIERLFSILKKNKAEKSVSEHTIELHLEGDQMLPDIAIDVDGTLLVCWTEVSEDGISLKLNADSFDWEDWIPDKYHPQIQKRFWLYPPSPSPFEKKIAIRFEMARAEKVTITVYDATGRRIIRLNDTQLPEGAHQLTWDGTDGNGKKVSVGSYFILMQTADFHKTRKVIKAK
jgi:hypothetical protein